MHVDSIQFSFVNNDLKRPLYIMSVIYHEHQSIKTCPVE